MFEALKPKVEMTRAKILKRKKDLSDLQIFLFYIKRVDPTTMSTRSLDCRSLEWRLKMTWSCPASPRAPVFGACIIPVILRRTRLTDNLRIPFFFATEKEQSFFILRLLLLQCLLVQPNIILHQVLKLVHALHTLRHSKNQVLFPSRCL